MHNHKCFVFLLLLRKIFSSLGQVDLKNQDDMDAFMKCGMDRLMPLFDQGDFLKLKII